MGDLPDFENMSEEEQMRWLESLAKRQGADEGFTTAADLDVPEVDPDSVVIDEPGYVPYSESSSATSSQPSQPTETPPPQETAQPERELEPQVEVPPPAPPPAAEPVIAAADTGDYDDVVGDDPMAWLESLAKRQGADERGFTTSADIEVPEVDPDSVVIDEPGYTPYYESAATQPLEVPQAEEEEPLVQEVPPAPVAETPPQYETPPPPMEQEPEPEPVPEAPLDEMPVPDEAPAAPIGAMAEEGELPSDIDPMAWLESLAKRQGAHEGFTTAADLEVPEIDPDSVVIDEPGYTPYSATQTTAGAAPPSPPPEPEPTPEPVIEEVGYDELPEEEATDDWLTELARAPESDVGEFLDDLSDTDFFPAVEEDVEPIGEKEEEPAFDLSMTDEEIAQAQAAGTITPEQELAWLQSKMSSVPEEDLDMAQGEVAPAEPVEVPDWLAAQRPSEEELDALAESGVPEGDMSFDDTLLEEEFDLDDLVGEIDDFELEPEPEPVPEDEAGELVATQDLLEGYSPEADEWAQAIDEDLQIDDLDSVPEPEWYTQAIEQADEDAAQLEASATAVFDEALTGDDTAPIAATVSEGDLPDWLQGVETTLVEEDPDLPDWLRVSPTAEADEVMDWLPDQPTSQLPAVEPVAAQPEAAPPLEPAPEPVVPAVEPALGDLPSEDEEWLVRGEAGAIPSWYPYEVPAEPVPEPVAEQAPPPVSEPVARKEAAEPAPEIQKQPTQPPSPPTPTPTPSPAPPPAAVTTGGQFDHYRARLQQNPEDYDSRLGLARELNRAGALNEGLQEYESLIEKSAMLETVSDDLAGLIKQLPRHPKARRLLGDVYMRQGRLQEALDTYRGALDQI